jgi:flagellar biogenesis protein FliO
MLADSIAGLSPLVFILVVLAIIAVIIWIVRR